MGPVLGWKVVKSKECFLVLLKTFTGFWEFDLVTGKELFVGRQSRFTGGGQVHFVDQLLGFCLNALGHFIEDIRRLMRPAALLRDRAVFLLQSDPESQ